MDKILFDSHSHISDDAYADYPDLFAEEIKNSAIKYCMDIGSSVESSKKCVASSKTYDFCYASVGVHPSEVADLTDEALFECLSYFNSEPKVVAVGEIGLDYHYEDGPSRELQQLWFRKQLRWAIENKAPICIHSREADEDTLRILKEEGAFSKSRAVDFPPKPDGSADCRVLIHCFSGSAELARQYVKLGAWIALGGAVTFKNARKAVEVAETVDLNSLLIETDAPYMAPVPLRGSVNKPFYVEYVAKKIAELRNLSYEEVADITLKNACRFYGIEDKR